MTSATVLELFATISEIDAASSSEPALEIFQRVVQRYGLHSFAIARLPAPSDREWHRAILHNGWTSEWFARYESEGHFPNDPCAARSRLTAEPFLWHQLPIGSLTPRGRLVMDEAAEFGMKDGICVPIHVPLAGPAVVTAGGDYVEVAPGAMPLIETLCVHLFRKVSVECKSDNDEGLPLTPRERELLQWSAQGKTTEDISCILGITANTIESHQRNIRNKLDAVNVLHAVVKALRRCEIQI
jgi:LuxR family transcriptional regulator, quorum-sensing system regulator BjaR1